MKNLKNPREKNVILDKSRQLPTQAAYEMILAKLQELTSNDQNDLNLFQTPDNKVEFSLMH